MKQKSFVIFIIFAGAILSNLFCWLGMAKAEEEALFSREDAFRAKIERLEAESRDLQSLNLRLRQEIESCQSIGLERLQWQEERNRFKRRLEELEGQSRGLEARLESLNAFMAEQGRRAKEKIKTMN